MRIVRLAEPSGCTVADALGYLADAGIVLPDDTDDGNFLERLCVALHALKGGKGQTGDTRPAPEVTEEQGVVSMSLSGRRVYHPPLRPNLPPGVRLSQPVDDKTADEVLRQWDAATGRNRGA